MTEISILDLQNLRHLISGYSTTHCKMTDYASKAEDPEIKKLFLILSSASWTLRKSFFRKRLIPL